MATALIICAVFGSVAVATVVALHVLRRDLRRVERQQSEHTEHVDRRLSGLEHAVRLLAEHALSDSAARSIGLGPRPIEITSEESPERQRRPMRIIGPVVAAIAVVAAAVLLHDDSVGVELANPDPERSPVVPAPDPVQMPAPDPDTEADDTEADEPAPTPPIENEPEPVTDDVSTPADAAPAAAPDAPPAPPASGNGALTAGEQTPPPASEPDLAPPEPPTTTTTTTTTTTLPPQVAATEPSTEDTASVLCVRTGLQALPVDVCVL
jgi:hypothetical protein